MTVAIRGAGVASRCCAHLLAMHGIDAALIPIDRTPLPALLLSDPALALLRDVFGRPDLFADRRRISRRIVSWGGGDPVALPHGAVIVSESELLAVLGPAPDAAPSIPADMTLHTAPPFPAGTVRHFGERAAVAAAVDLLRAEDKDACWIEAIANGWLFLMPGEEGQGWLLGVGAPLDMLLAGSAHITPRIRPKGQTGTPFDTAPRLLTSLQGPDWLACGTAAMAFDPICGDGTAHAVREAILASAVIAGIREGGDVPALRTHYESMLIAAMRRHLLLCADLYRAGGTGDWWQTQHATLLDGHRWTTARLATLPGPQYRLHDFSLVPMEVAA